MVNFPNSEEFIDFAGNKRRFTLSVSTEPHGFWLYAIENPDSKGGYMFTAYSPVDPYQALWRLRKKVPKLLSVRHLAEENGKLTMTHDRLRGRVGYGGVSVDGQFIEFQDFLEMLQTYEGFQFDLRIRESSE